LIAGVDEAGRGPLAGPVVAGAVLLYRTRFTTPIDDSKRLAPSVRQRAFGAILRAASVGIGAVAAEQIDRLGIEAATHLAMIRALQGLRVVPDLVLVDGNRLPPGCELPMMAVVGGDSKSLSIACASIVAKVMRDRWMRWVHLLHPEYGFARHKGYGTAKHLQRLGAIGPCGFHRFSFRPVAARGEGVG